MRIFQLRKYHTATCIPCLFVINCSFQGVDNSWVHQIALHTFGPLTDESAGRNTEVNLKVSEITGYHQRQLTLLRFSNTSLWDSPSTLSVTDKSVYPKKYKSIFKLTTTWALKIKTYKASLLKMEFYPPLWVGQYTTFFEKKNVCQFFWSKISYAIVSPYRASRNYTLLSIQL